MVKVGRTFVLDRMTAEGMSTISEFQTVELLLVSVTCGQKAGIRISNFPKSLNKLLLISSHERTSFITEILSNYLKFPSLHKDQSYSQLYLSSYQQHVYPKFEFC